MLLEGENDSLIMLPSDKALLDDPKTRELVELYAKVTSSPSFTFYKCVQCNLFLVYRTYSFLIFLEYLVHAHLM